MADARIQDLDEALSVGSNDLFVLEQANAAKKLTGATLIADLATALDGHGGIASIEKTSSSGITDTFTITYADETTDTFTMDNGNGIASIVKTTTSGLVDTYVMTLDNGNTFTYYVTNGAQGDPGVGHYVWIKYSAINPTQNSDMTDNPDKFIGIYTGAASTAPTDYTAYTWYEFKGATGNTGPGISSIEKTSTSGLVDTYTVTLTNGATTTFSVTNGQNGSSISSISKTGTTGLTDVYTVTLTNGSTSYFEVTNGRSIESITLTDGTHAPGTSDTYTILFNNGDTTDFTVYNGTNGTGSVSTVNGIAPVNQNVTTLAIGNAVPTTSTAGEVNQLYCDITNHAIYVCSDTTGGVYTWAALSADNLPSQTGQGGKALMTNGSSTYWGAVASAWGEITGTLSNQTDLANALAGKQDTLTNTDLEIQGAVSNSHTHSNKSILDTIPTTGTDGYVLKKTTLGTEWGAAPDTLPSQSGNSGKYLTTNGTNASWAAVSGGTWGSITGTLSDQTDLNTQLTNLKELKFTSFSGQSWTGSSPHATDTAGTYPNRYSIPCSGVTGAMYPEVTFGVASAISGIYSPLCECYAGGVYIWAKSQTAPTIKAILVHKA